MIVEHKENLRDRATMLAMRGLLAMQPAMTGGPEDRPGFDELMMKTPCPAGVTFVAATVGGVSGWWCRPAETRGDGVILYFHGGAYVMGSASAYRNFVGQLTDLTGMAAFIPEYSLAPEHPFPAAFDDGLKAYCGLIAENQSKIVLAGDSAGGGLALALLGALCGDISEVQQPLAAIAMSPWIDLSLGGESIQTRAKADPILTKEILAHAASLYLSSHDPRDARVCALSSRNTNLPRVQIHVGSDEILLDDAVRYTRAIEQSEGMVDLHVWSGMTHVFPSSPSVLKAAGEALDLIGEFLKLAAGNS